MAARFHYLHSGSCRYGVYVPHGDPLPEIGKPYEISESNGSSFRMIPQAILLLQWQSEGITVHMAMIDCDDAGDTPMTSSTKLP